MRWREVLQQIRKMRWKETKKRTTHNRYFPSLAALKERLFRRFNRFQGNPASLRNLLASFA